MFQDLYNQYRIKGGKHEHFISIYNVDKETAEKLKQTFENQPQEKSQ